MKIKVVLFATALCASTLPVLAADGIKNAWGGDTATRGPLLDLDGFPFDPSDGGAMMQNGVPTAACGETVKNATQESSFRGIKVNGFADNPASHCTRPGQGNDGGNTILFLMKQKI